MSQSSNAGLVIIVPAHEIKVYRSASRILVSALGTRAPDTIALILHELKRRNPESIAAEYLYYIGRQEPRRRTKPQLTKSSAGDKTAGNLPLKRASLSPIRQRLSIMLRPTDLSRN